MNRIVTHFIAGFPNFDTSLEVAGGLIAGGAFALEMQIPFSDPCADGPVIESACGTALKNGFTAADAWKLLELIRNESDIPVFVMSYASLLIAPGLTAFIRHAKDAGATGLIVPDLVPGSDENLYAAAADAGVPAVPVIVPWIDDDRLDAVLAVKPQWLYVALRSGITGSYTELGETQKQFLQKLKKRGGPRVMAGFGIQQPLQAAAVTEYADAAVAGSVFVKTVQESGPQNAGRAVRKVIENLRNGQHHINL